MADVRIELGVGEDHRDALLRSIEVADDVVGVRPDGESAVVRLAGYDGPQAESRVQEIVRTAATQVGVDPTAPRVLGDGWQFGEDHVGAPPPDDGA